MPQKILDQMYWSGYCDETIANAEKTDFALGGPERVAWMQKHLPECKDCWRASKFKELEFRAVKRMDNKDALTAFHMGTTNLMKMPGYLKNMDSIIGEEIASNRLTQEDIEWIHTMATRYGKPWVRK